MSDFDLREQAKNLLREIAGRELHQPDFFSDVAIADAEAFGRRCREEAKLECREEAKLDKKRLDWYEANPRKISICAAPLISFWVWDEVENRMYLRLREAIDYAIRVEERSR